MALYRESIIPVDLERGQAHVDYDGVILAAGDVSANRFGIKAKRNGADESLSGSCTGYFVKPDGQTVTISGTVSGNTAYVELPASCYSVEGHFTLSIKLTSSGFANTVRIIQGTIVKVSTT